MIGKTAHYAISLTATKLDNPFRVCLFAIARGVSPEAYKRLEVSIVQHLVIDKLTGFDKSSSVAYTPNMVEASLLVESGEDQLAFVLNSISVTTIKAIADANDKMPGKSTYFYPKLPTGLVINRLEGTL